MTETRGVFSLRTVVKKKILNDWVDLSDVWVSPSPIEVTTIFPNTGYFGGGFPLSSTMDKVTYASDTTAAVPGAALSAARYAMGATGNSTAGYFGGGHPGPVSTMEKVTYSTDTTAAVPGAALSAARYALAATGNSTAGYFGGGYFSGQRSTMDKVTYSTDTTAAVPGAFLSDGRSYLAATGNSESGYFGGGQPGPRSTMDKVTYSTDTTVAVPGAALSVARSYLGATGNSGAGYFGGGSVTTMEKVTYASDTLVAVPGSFLTTARYGVAASSARANALPETITTINPASSSPAVRFNDGTSATPNTGYFGGGINFPAIFTTMNKVTYSSDTTTAVPGAALSVARFGAAATGNSTAGYFGGGGALPSPATFSTMDKVTYSTDTTAAVPGAALSVARTRPAASSARANANLFPSLDPPEQTSQTPKTTLVPTLIPSPNTGYFGGGFSGLSRDIMDKVTYSTDTIAAVPGAALNATRFYLAATGNSTAGYFGGGDVGGSVTFSGMDKVSYAIDTTVAVPGASLSVARSALSATGNSTAGYFGGGNVPGPSPFFSTMDKVTYASDTTAAVPGAALSIARYGAAASSARANALPVESSIIPIPVPVIV